MLLSLWREKEDKRRELSLAQRLQASLAGIKDGLLKIDVKGFSSLEIGGFSLPKKLKTFFKKSRRSSEFEGFRDLGGYRKPVYLQCL